MFRSAKICTGNKKCFAGRKNVQKGIRNLQAHNIKRKKSKLKLSGMVSIENHLVKIYNSYKIETKKLVKTNKQTNKQNLCEERKVNVDKQEWTYPICKCQVFNTWYEIIHIKKQSP